MAARRLLLRKSSELEKMGNKKNLGLDCNELMKGRVDQVIFDFTDFLFLRRIRPLYTSREWSGQGGMVELGVATKRRSFFSFVNVRFQKKE